MTKIRKARPNEYINHGEWTEIVIDSPTHGEFRIKIDTDDLDKVKIYPWCINKCWNKKTNLEPIWYAGYGGNYDKGIKSMLLHRYIMNNPKGKIVDHRSRNTLDCRKENLRVCTQSQNKMNTKKQINNDSGHTGVFFDNNLVTPKWMAFIQVNYKRKHLGYFDTYEEAVEAREKAEQKYFGEFTRVD
jgi:hypothetical protein